MIFHFKTLDYQRDAVDSIVKCFEGQEYSDGLSHRHDFGSEKMHQARLNLDSEVLSVYNELAFSNNDFSIDQDTILRNIRNVQIKQHLLKSDKLEKGLGTVSLDIDMETGTGKTYVYTKAMFELNKTYGWSKYIIVVPSIAIREGVYKSIQQTTDHFMEEYGKKIRAFIYNSSDLHKIDEFSQNSGINVMIINSQAFATSLKEGAKNEGSRIIYTERDEFGSRKPIDIIAANRPILILDEPQKLNGDATQNALRKHFNVLFSMNFSATHAVEHNRIYSLDALDANNKKLVKMVEVKGVNVDHDSGSNCYLYFESIVLNGKSGPTARVELYVNHKTGVRKETHILRERDNLYEASNHVESYKGLFISQINGKQDTLTLSTSLVLHAGTVIGDVTEENTRRIQIRDTIVSHLDKEERLFKRGIKVLSLFFIDEVSKYRQYNELGQPVLGEYGRIFEEEFSNILETRLFDPEYVEYLKKIPVNKLHAGYFSIDKKGHMVNSTKKRNSEESDDTDAYDLILRNKERLLSLDEPVRFIFSHSALSEGWDNPNIFQICSLRHTESTVRRRQELGRGLRICVNQQGERQDLETLGPLFSDINLLTVLADEDYKTFIRKLYDETINDLGERIAPISKDNLIGKEVQIGSEEVKLDATQAKQLYNYLIKNDYLDLNDMPNDKLRTDLYENKLVDLPPELNDLKDGIKALLDDLSASKAKGMCGNARKPKIKENKLNENFKKKEFLELWNEINHLYHYKVSFDSEELINHTVKHINDELFVTGRNYTVTTGRQKEGLTYEDVKNKTGFDNETTRTENFSDTAASTVKYDLIGKITAGTGLTRRTVAKILSTIESKKFDYFKVNPEEFINKTIRLINEEKATSIINHVVYEQSEKRFDNEIFTMNRPEFLYSKAYEAKKNIQDYIFPDSDTERDFAQKLDGAEEVVVYAKLPDGKGGFYIPTPVGDYSPDWAIAFNKDSVRHIFFVAETKGSMSSMNLDKIEESKIKCAAQLFKDLHADVQFFKIDSYKTLLSFVKGSETHGDD